MELRRTRPVNHGGSHRPTDTRETLDYGFMRRVTQLLVATVVRQARGG